METYGAELVGRGALKFYESAGISIRATNLSGRKGIISSGAGEVYVRRQGARRWEVRSEGRSYCFGSQWELLAWIGDRL